MKMENINFVLTASLKSVVQAAGIKTISVQPVGCPLQVGDVISHPSARGLFFKVIGRWFAAGDDEGKQAGWFLLLDQADDPLAVLDAKP